ncbi:MAG TPA: porin [Pseudolabrys sp.]|nr:porin [Pseudolabrys sp.]
MKMVKSLLLGTAAGFVAVAGAQAADLPVKAKPVQYVKICSLYGAGFYYIPGTDTCIKIGGYVRAEWNYQAANSFKPFLAYNPDNPNLDRYNERTRAGITVDVRSQTAYGTLRAYAVIMPTFSNDGATTGGSPYANAGDFAVAQFIQFAGFTFGKTASFFDFDTNPYTNATVWWGSAQAGNGQNVFAYTAQFGNGFSASLSAEDPSSRRSSITGVAVGATSSAYGGRRWPDVVANLRIDQAWGSAQVMGAIHDTYGTVTTSGVDSSDTGWAIGAGLRINLPMIGRGDYIIGQVNYSEGATNYVMSQAAAGGLVANLADGYPVTAAATRAAVGYVYDAVNVGGAATNLDLTKAWSFTAGFEHVWNPQWKTSLYGSYGEFNYSTAASAVIAGNFTGFAATGSTSADWSMWQIGSRTVWTPVANLDLSVDVLYTKVNTGFEGSSSSLGTFRDNDIWSAMFRAQRNFWP